MARRQPVSRTRTRTRTRTTRRGTTTTHTRSVTTHYQHHQMKPARKAALRKAQLASAAARRGKAGIKRTAHGASAAKRRTTATVRRHPKAAVGLAAGAVVTGAAGGATVGVRRYRKRAAARTAKRIRLEKYLDQAMAAEDAKAAQAKPDTG